MGARLQTDNLRRGGRQPQVLHFDDGLAVDNEVVATGHLLTDVEQQGIVARLGNGDGALEDMTLADFLPATLGSRHIDNLLTPGS